MRGLLADVNVQGHLPYLRRLIAVIDLWEVLAAEAIEFAEFAHVHLSQELDDRAIWNFCQAEGWVLLTDNRNEEGANSLQATLGDSWRPGHLPIVTISDREKFVRMPEYATRVATQIADVLYGVVQGEYRDRPRIFVPH